MFDWKTIGRKSMRLPGYDYSQPGMYFVTIDTQNFERIFGTVTSGVVRVDPCIDPHDTNAHMELSELGQIIHEYWQKLPSKFPNVRLDEFVIMPNHIHGIIEIMGTGESRFAGTTESMIAGMVAGMIAVPLRGSIHGSTPTTGAAAQFNGLPRFMQWFKQMSSNAFIQYHREHKTYFNRRLWQRGYYEHIIRNNNDLDRIRVYIRNNPERWAKKYGSKKPT